MPIPHKASLRLIYNIIQNVLDALSTLRCDLLLSDQPAWLDIVWLEMQKKMLSDLM